MRSALLFRLATVVTLLTLASACDVFSSTCKDSDRTCLSNPLLAKGVDGECTRTADCKDGLFCDANKCSFRGDTKTGEKCRLTAECGDADYCGSQRVCQLAGLAGKGADCMTTGDCKHGLVCETPDLGDLRSVNLASLAEISGQCKAGGTLEQGMECASVSECLAGLNCVEIDQGSGVRRCFSLPPSDTELPAIPLLWGGIDCPEVAATDAKESYFLVPRTGKKPKPSDFYSLPFPNDIRLKGGSIDMQGHPVAPSSFGLPFVERYIEVAGEDLSGFSTNPVISFRFSHPYDFSTVHGEDTMTGKPATVSIIDITPSSPQYGKEVGLAYKTSEGKLSNYVCPHWLALRVVGGSAGSDPVPAPLRPGTTYAAIVTKGVTPTKSKDGMSGGSFARGADLDALLGATAPADADLKAAYTAYKPLRDWAADKGENPANFLNVAVFTTQEPEALIPKLRAQIQNEMPSVSMLTECVDKNTPSPCEDLTDKMKPRGLCRDANPDFVEVYGKIKLPIFQTGTPPYTEPTDGGGFELDGSGTPKVQRYEDVCFAMSVPKKPAPAAGYPVLVYGHGTGGAFNGEMDGGGFAPTLARGSIPAVLIAIDMPEHGSRRGDSTESPEGLFYNFLNPRAARDNVLQGSADLMSVVRWVKVGGGLPAVGSLPKTTLDVAHIALMGHSQGATHSALVASYEPDIIGVVLSGVGGHLSTSMLTKTMPVDIASVVPLGLLDPDSSFKLAGGLFNPGLAIIQSVFDRADPINYAQHLYRNPTAEVPTGLHAFMTYGIGDSFAPVETQTAYALAGRLTAVAPLTPDVPLTQANGPLVENVSVGGTPRSVGMRQYTPVPPSDGHFVGVSVGQPGRPEVERFLDMLLAGMPPEIGTAP